jgi:crotonobetaine/carnitine-CoA ligase
MHDLWASDDNSTIPELLDRACRQWPDNLFLDFSGDQYSYRQTRHETGRVAAGLRELGVQPGDRVCSILDNGPDAIFLWFAVNSLGAIYVPINTDYKGEYLRHQISDADASLIVVEADYAERVYALVDVLPSLKRVLVRAGPVGDGHPIATGSFEGIKADAPLTEFLPVKAGDLAMLIYTSGTTGPSKGCMIPHSYAVNFGRQCQWMTRTGPGDVIWTPCPLFHANAAFGVVLNALVAGAASAIVKRFSVSGFWPDVERSAATHLSLLSVMLTLIPGAGETEESRRYHGRVKVLYGSPLGTELKQKWKDLFGVQHAAQPGYGMTEACLITMTSCFVDNVPGNASGRRHDDFDVRVIDDNGNECPPDVAGEIIVRPRKPGIMFQGYWRRPEATVEATRNMWFHTGDLGKFDENDFFYFVDRKKDYLRRGGENISSYEVEACFRGHDDVAEVAAHAVPSDMAEDELKITVKLKDHATVTEEELCRWSLERLPHFAVPRYVEFRDAFPTTPTGKVQKAVLREQGVTAGTWDRKQSQITIPNRGRPAG